MLFQIIISSGTTKCSFFISPIFAIFALFVYHVVQLLSFDINTFVSYVQSFNIPYALTTCLFHTLFDFSHYQGLLISGISMISVISK